MIQHLFSERVFINRDSELVQTLLNFRPLVILELDVLDIRFAFLFIAALFTVDGIGKQLYSDRRFTRLQPPFRRAPVGSKSSEDAPLPLFRSAPVGPVAYRSVHEQF